MTSPLARDFATFPDVFDVTGPVPREALEEWSRHQDRVIPPSLLEIWSLIGGGDIFETEEIFSPLIDNEYEIVNANRDLAAQGLPGDCLAFHAGLYVTAADRTGQLRKFDADSFAAAGTFRTADDWYQDLRREYGAKYGLPAGDRS